MLSALFSDVSSAPRTVSVTEQAFNKYLKNLFNHPSTQHPSITIHPLSIHTCVHLLIHPSTHHPSLIYPLLHHLSVPPSVHPFIHPPSFHLSIHPPYFHPFICPSIHLYIFPYIHPYTKSYLSSSGQTHQREGRSTAVEMLKEPLLPVSQQLL